MVEEFFWLLTLKLLLIFIRLHVTSKVVAVEFKMFPIFTVVVAYLLPAAPVDYFEAMLIFRGEMAREKELS